MALKRKKSTKPLDVIHDVPALRRQALAAVLRRVIVDDPDVIEYRARYLAGKPLPQSKSTSWWKSMPKDSPARRDAELIADSLGNRLQVQPFDILQVMIWDYRPEIAPVQVHPYGYDGRFNLASPMPAAARLCLTISISATTDEILEAIKGIRAEHLRMGPGSRARLQSEKHLYLAIFLAEHGDAGALGKAGMDRWNRQFPHWAYRGEVKTFNRDAVAAYKRIGTAGLRDSLHVFIPVGQWQKQRTLL